MSSTTQRSPLFQVAHDTFLHALKSVAPEQLVQAAVSLDATKTKLRVQPRSGEEQVEFDLKATPSILILGAGKATQELVSGLLHVLDEVAIPLSIKVQANYPKGQVLRDQRPIAQVSLREASHPISDESTINGTNEQVQQLYHCDPNTLVIVLMSGGGSALFETTAVFDGNEMAKNDLAASKITLKDIQEANRVLIESGANITEINIIRKHFSQVKGGRLAQHAMKSQNVVSLIGLYLSDVVGNDLSSVASGPSCPDVSTFADCAAILAKYNVTLPPAITQVLIEAKEETPKPDDPIFHSGKIFNFLIGSADTSAQAASELLLPLGFEHHILTNRLDGEASQYGHHLPELIKEKAKNKKIALIATGEFTVTIKGRGTGGRNQEMLLALLHRLSMNKELLDPKHDDFAVLSCAFDGIEGNSPATGAIVDSSSLARLQNALGDVDLTAYLLQKLNDNDSFRVFETLEDAIITGYTGTNVNDLTLILLAPRSL